MPTKTKTKKAKTKRASRPKTPTTVVTNHPFAPGTAVRFLPAAKIEVERRAGREPMPKPDKTAKVKADGTLEVRGLSAGLWCAAGPVGDGWSYTTFSVKK